MERFILQLIGLNLRKGQDNIIDFEHHSKLFRLATKILSEIFGSTFLATIFKIHLILLPLILSRI
jgi:hypothetical protein